MTFFYARYSWDDVERSRYHIHIWQFLYVKKCFLKNFIDCLRLLLFLRGFYSSSHLVTQKSVDPGMSYKKMNYFNHYKNSA